MPPVISGAAEQPRAKREYTAQDRILLAVALLIGILFDRLGWFGPWHGNEPFVMSASFWLCYLVIFYVLFWEKVRLNKVSWLVASMCVMLCAWNFIFDPDCEYGWMTYLVIPNVLMAHAVYASGGFKLKQAGVLALEWLCGWFVKPFSAISVCFGSIASMVNSGKNSTLKKILLGAAITLPILLVLLPLLSGADLVFGYYMQRMLSNFRIGPFLGHAVICVIAAALFYSFLWNLGSGKTKNPAKPLEISFDRLVCGIVLGVVLAVYAMFCAVQFVYLFAGAGLPDGLTYSEYAREGFWQLVVVSGINLLLFGILLRFVARTRWFGTMLSGLLAATALLLVSAILRLGMYINAFGLTWLRLLSAWFIIYLAVTLVLCAVRMIKEKLPLIAVCALVLLVWYVALGYANPEMLIERYNLAFHAVL